MTTDERDRVAGCADGEFDFAAFQAYDLLLFPAADALSWLSEGPDGEYIGRRSPGGDVAMVVLQIDLTLRLSREASFVDELLPRDLPLAFCKAVERRMRPLHARMHALIRMQRASPGWRYRTRQLVELADRSVTEFLPDGAWWRRRTAVVAVWA